MCNVKYLLWYFERWAKQFFIQFSFLQIYLIWNLFNLFKIYLIIYLRWKSVESRVYNSYVFKNITYVRKVFVIFGGNMLDDVRSQ